MNLKTKKSNFKSIKEITKGSQSSQISEKSNKFDKLAANMDDFVERQGVKTKLLIDKMKAWDKELKKWFPTGDMAYSSDFQIKFRNNGQVYQLDFSEGKIKVRNGQSQY